MAEPRPTLRELVPQQFCNCSNCDAEDDICLNCKAWIGNGPVDEFHRDLGVLTDYIVEELGVVNAAELFDAVLSRYGFEGKIDE